MRIYSEIPGRAMCIFAHPDDADMGAGGTIAKWSTAGTEIVLVVACTGDKGTVDSTTDPKYLVEQRDRELCDSAATLGISAVERLLIADGDVENSRALRERIVRLVRVFRPQVVISHDPTAIFFGTTYYNHRDHRELGFATLDAVLPAAYLPHYFPESGPSHKVERVLLAGTLEANVGVDISMTVNSKIDAALCHKTQVGPRSKQLSDSIQSSAKHCGKRLSVAGAENFRELVNGWGAN